jgi:hypothetical protein
MAQLLKSSMFRIAVLLQNELRKTCPVDTGILRNSIVVRPNENGTSLIISMKEYGKYVEFGTPPHVIVPVQKESLRFEKDRKSRLSEKRSPKEGDFVFAKKVRHPGTMPNPFIRNALLNKLPEIIALEIKRLVG